MLAGRRDTTRDRIPGSQGRSASQRQRGRTRGCYLADTGRCPSNSLKYGLIYIPSRRSTERAPCKFDDDSAWEARNGRLVAIRCSTAARRRRLWTSEPSFAVCHSGLREGRRLSFAIRALHAGHPKFPSALLPDETDSYKSDLSVDSVHTHFGRTNKGLRLAWRP
jgi:hypothetical protein